MVCDSCIDALMEEGFPAEGASNAELNQFCIDMGGDIADHICEEWEECQCGCRRHRND